MLAVRGILLLFASAVVFAGMWAAYRYIDDGLSAQMMGFELEPAQGWGYWRWHLIKRSMWGILGTIAILVGFASVVFWGWVALVREVRRRIFAVALASTLATLIAHSGSLDGPLRSIAGDLTNKELVANEAAKAASNMAPDSLVNESLAFLFAGNDTATEAAAVRFLLALESFPFDAMVSRFKTSTSSTERAYTLHLLNLGARDHTSSEIVRKLAESVLYDKGAGLRRYGEARAYSSEGKRVCDVAYNILVSKMGLRAEYPLLDVDNNVTIQRDQMIEKLGVELNLPKPPSWDAPTQSSSGPVPSDLVSPKSPTPRKVTKEKSAMIDDKSSSSMLWSVVTVFIVAAIGLLWLVFRKRR